MATLVINTWHLCLGRDYQAARLGSIRPYLIPPETEPQVRAERAGRASSPGNVSYLRSARDFGRYSETDLSTPNA